MPVGVPEHSPIKTRQLLSTLHSSTTLMPNDPGEGGRLELAIRIVQTDQHLGAVLRSCCTGALPTPLCGLEWPHWLQLLSGSASQLQANLSHMHSTSILHVVRVLLHSRRENRSRLSVHMSRCRIATLE